jgi:hypothetical protein
VSACRVKEEAPSLRGPKKEEPELPHGFLQFQRSKKEEWRRALKKEEGHHTPKKDTAPPPP